MKIRLHDSSIRVRLSLKDIEELKNHYSIMESLPFANSKTLYFKLILSEKNDIALDENAIMIKINKADFARKEDGTIEWKSKEGLKLLIERDYYD